MNSNWLYAVGTLLTWFGWFLALRTVILAGNYFSRALGLDRPRLRSQMVVSAIEAGVLLALVPIPLLIILGVWIVVFAVTRYVSLASICASATLPFASWLTGQGTALILVTAAFAGSAAACLDIRKTTVAASTIPVIRRVSWAPLAGRRSANSQLPAAMK